jgi:alkanesulfonate monooxygenase SsuD/methylene tetrahydromethanopterin reductase-like flavin-dependent oxidoreductase (luciferase family)
VRVGVTLPTFRDDATVALDSARRAEALGLDGVFVFDHLWPMGQSDRPALSAFPMLGAVASVTTRISVGPLVARIGLVPDAVLVAELASLAHMAPGRLIAGLGTGDRKSAAENEAYGIPPGPPDERRLALARCARAVLDLGVPVWVGGGSVSTTELAVDLGPGAAVNLWGGQPSAIAALTGRCEVTWGGPVAGDVPQIALELSELAEAGATWAVCAWPESLDAVAEVAQMLRDA